MSKKQNLSSKLALGTVQFGLDYGISNIRGKIPEKEVFEILNLAAEKGIDTLDTSEVYGTSEDIIGKYLKKNKKPFKIITKNASETHQIVEKAFNQSLKRMNQEKLYGCLIHDFNKFINDKKIIDELFKLKEKGLVEKIGFSLYFPSEIDFIIRNDFPIDIVQIPFNVFDQRFTERFKILKYRKIEIHARSIFLQGLVFKKGTELTGKLIKASEKLSYLNEISHRSRIPITALCLGFGLNMKSIDKILIGVDSKTNLVENLEYLNGYTKVKDYIDDLKSLEENDIDIILPFNWNK